MSTTALPLPDGPARAELTLGALFLNVRIARHWAGEQAREIGLAELDIEGLLLALTEICTNSILHAYGGERADRTLSLRIWALPDGLLLSIRDEGSTIPAAALEPPDMSVPRTGGYGLMLARTLTDGWWVDTSRRLGNEIRLFKRLPGAPPI